MVRRKIFSLLVVGLALLTLTACLSKSSSKTKVIVATDSDTAPFTYKEGEDFKGYDIEVLKAIFKNSKDYEVEFQTVDFPSILLGIDAGRFQIAANDFNYNEERAEKYLFSDPVSLSNYSLVHRKNQHLTSLSDLSGKKTEAIAGSNYAQLLEKWNKENPDKTPIEIQYVANSTGVSQRLQDIESGKIDFVLYDAISSSYIAKDQGVDVAISSLEDDLATGKDGLEYFLFAKDEEGEKLQTFVNQRLKDLQKDGTLAKISQTYFGADYTVKP